MILVESIPMGMFLIWCIKKAIIFHVWRVEKERREARHVQTEEECKKLTEMLEKHLIKNHFPHFFDTPMNLSPAKPLTDALKDYVGMLIMNSETVNPLACDRYSSRCDPTNKFRGRFRWKEKEIEITKGLVSLGAAYIKRYLELSTCWCDDELLKISDSGVAVKYEEAYNSVHSIIQEDEDYKNLTQAVEMCQKKKSEYNDSIDKIPDVGDRLVALYETAAVVRYGHFNELMTSVGKEAGVQVNLAPLKGLFRVLEKVVMRPDAGVPWDIIRGQLVCKTMGEIEKVLTLMAAHKDTRFLGVNNRFARPARGWADVGIYLIFDIEDCDTAVCEVQIVHENMMLVREQMGAHDSYDNSRLAAEILRLRKKGRYSEVKPAETFQTVVSVLPVSNGKVDSSSVVVPIPPDTALAAKVAENVNGEEKLDTHLPGALGTPREDQEQAV